MVHRQIDAANSPAQNPEDKLHGFPPQVTSFVGRTQEISDIIALMTDPHCRLVTLVGPGGIGKTRLALEVARRLDFADGIYYVPLQALRSGDHVLSSLANALDFQAHSSVDLHQQLGSFLSKKQLLLVLDNFEQVLEAAGFISAMLADAPMVKALATSREPLNLQEEWVRRLRGLAYPENDVSMPLLSFNAVRLFVERAQQQRGDFHLEDEAERVVRICRLVDGLPLALELAAGWSRTLSCVDIAAEIQGRIDFLTTSARNIPERHRSMRAVFDHSWSLLSQEEAHVMSGFSVFRGGCTRAAAEAVLGASLRDLSRLVDKSLLRYSAGRYDVHELQRQYAEEQLELSGEGDAIRDRHCNYYATLFHMRHQNDAYRSRHVDYLQTAHAELDNIRASWTWALEQGHYEVIDQLADTLWQYYTDHSPAFELGELYQAASERLAACDGPRERAILGRVLARQGKYETTMLHMEYSETLLRQSMAIALEQDNLFDYYYAMNWLAHWVLGYYHLDYATAKRMLEECVAYYRQHRERLLAGLAHSLNNLSFFYARLDQVEQQKEALHESLRLYQEVDFPQGISEVLNNLGDLHLKGGQWTEAEQYYAQALNLPVRVTTPVQRQLAFIAVMQGDFIRAEKLVEVTLFHLQNTVTSHHMNYVFNSFICNIIRSLMADARGALSDALSMAGQALASVQHSGLNEQVKQGHMIHGWIACGQEAFEQASGDISTALSSTPKSLWGLVDRLLAIATYARILAHRGEVLYATELLGLVFNHPNGPQGYLKKHQGMTQLRADLEAELGMETCAAAWERGQSLDVDAVFADLMDEFLSQDLLDDNLRLSAHTRAANRELPEPLTPRELEILHLITQGLSNDEIASNLVVSVTTVKKHISHIYGKLNVQRRAQAITWAQDRQFFQE